MREGLHECGELVIFELARGGVEVQQVDLKAAVDANVTATSAVFGLKRVDDGGVTPFDELRHGLVHLPLPLVTAESTTERQSTALFVSFAKGEKSGALLHECWPRTCW